MPSQASVANSAFHVTGACSLVTGAQAVRLDCPPGSELAEDDFTQWCQAADGKRNGPSVEWLPTDDGLSRDYVQVCRHFKDGFLHGHEQWFHEGGRIASSGQYLLGKNDGTWKQWSTEGKLLGSNVLRNGSGVFTHWHDNGHKYSEGRLVDNNKDGLWQEWDETGRLLGSYAMKNGTGVERSWSPETGDLESETEFLDGEEHGSARFWISGKLLWEGAYLNGKKHGKWVEYYADGEVVESLYQNDQCVSEVCLE